MNVTWRLSLIYTQSVEYKKWTPSNGFAILKIFNREMWWCKFAVNGNLQEVERLVIHCRCFQYWSMPRGKHNLLAEIIEFRVCLSDLHTIYHNRSLYDTHKQPFYVDRPWFHYKDHFQRQGYSRNSELWWWCSCDYKRCTLMGRDVLWVDKR